MQAMLEKNLVYKRSPLIRTNLYRMITEAATEADKLKDLHQSQHC